MPVLRDDSLTAVIESPLSVVSRLFDQANHPVQDDGSDWGVDKYFSELVRDESFRDQVDGRP